ncbi:MAG: polysaccharide deacetylase [Oscillospiraceae bacterium]|nr:polysaccharide deacetylase [Oscillospiraceae bacterium]
MEHIIDHSTHTDETEDAVPSTSDTQRGAPPARTIFKPLFFAALALAVVLGGLAAFFYTCSMEHERNTALLNASKDFMRQQLGQAQSDLAAAQDALAQREEELAQAQDTIDFLAEYSVAAPDGTVPEYTQLYPDFYAPEWTGEAVAGGKVCCLTFDDGPSANTDRVLDTLNRYGVKGTFFIVGSTSTGAASQQRMRDIVAGGHTLAMHSWSHDYKKVYASVEAFLDEFYRLYQWIYEVTGVYPSVYRFPGGSINGYDRGVYQEIIAEMTRRGFVYFDWNASAQDATVTPRPAASIAADCLRGIGRDLVVVLTHDSAARSTTADALPAIIEGYQAAGYTFSALHPGVTPVTMGYPKIR